MIMVVVDCVSVKVTRERRNGLVPLVKYVYQAKMMRDYLEPGMERVQVSLFEPGARSSKWPCGFGWRVAIARPVLHQVREVPNIFQKKSMVNL